YMLLRGRPEDSLSSLEHALREEPLEVGGWGRAHGAPARAHNALGAHARGKEVCLRALPFLSEAELRFTAMNMIVQVELALAEAGLGNLDVAAQALDGLLARHAEHKGPLALGNLHGGRASVALLAGDQALFAEHTAEMTRWYRATGIQTLIERCQRVARIEQ